jgi:L-amino acid N-acyltransferase YncA
MISYQTERWTKALPEMRPLFELHWQEIALNHAKVPLNIWYEKYQALCDAGMLHVVTVRKDGELVGYHVAMVMGHLHYMDTLHGFTDVYYIKPAYRQGRVAIRMFQKVEQDMEALGVKKLVTAVKLHTADGKSGKLFEYLGYNHTEDTYTKLIGSQ